MFIVGGVEQFNLASNLKRGDVPFPKCIRIFQTDDVDTQTFFNRLHVTLDNSFDLHYAVYVPTANSAQTRNRKAPFELFIYFCCGSSLHPRTYLSTPRTECTPEGQRLHLNFVRRGYVAMPTRMPRKHFVVIEPIDDE